MAVALGLTTAGHAWAATCHREKLVEVPVTMVGARPTITVKVNGKDGQFLIDSGAFYSSIEPSGMTKLGLKPTFKPNIQVRGIGGVADADAVTVKEFTMASVPFRFVDFLVVEGAGAGIDGILGQNFLGKADVEYDLANGIIRFFTPTRCGNVNLAYWSTSGVNILDMLPTDMDRHIVASGDLDGKKIRVTFDTGASRSTLTLTAAARAGVTPQTPGVIRGGSETGMGSRRVDTWIAPFDSFRLDGEQVQHTRLRIGGLELPGSDMLLGADFFLSHRVYVANSAGKIYFTYNGGPVFLLDGGPVARSTIATTDPETGARGASDIDTPTDAAGFARRAAAFVARSDYVHAIDDYTRAIELDPSNPKTFYDRGEARIRNRQTVLAMSDFDQALTLKPDNAPALIMRANLYGLSGDAARAHIDLKTAAGLTLGDALLSFQVAQAYTRFKFYDEAIQAYDQAFAAKPASDLTPALYNGRCWARAMAKTDLDKALTDCSAALKLDPHNPALMDSRGVVHLERGELDAAIADYDAALRVQPKRAIALYGRGVAKLRKGAKADGDADIQAATALNAKIASQAKAIGLTP